MKLKITKVLAKELNKRINAFDIEYDELNESSYRFYVDCSIFDNEIDYNYKTDKFKVFRVIYPDSYYAMSHYITTKDLVRMFRRLSNKTIDDLVQEIINEYSI